MKRILFLTLALAFLAPAVCKAQSGTEGFLSRWWFTMLEDFSLPLNLTFEADDSGVAKPVIYSPAQSAEPLKTSKWSFANDTLHLTDKADGITLKLRWNAADSTFSGFFRQGLYRIEVLFVPAEGLFEFRRPQEPQPPYPYSEEDVVVERKKAGVKLAGTLTMPEGPGPFPAVVLVSGSGQQNRDEELLGHKPFKVLADHLTRQGIAVLRYDDRGVGGSTGDVENATTLDFADDAEAMFDYLRKHKGIDSRRVGIVGHSEGGLIADIVASRNRRMAFIVTLGGPGTTGGEILSQQMERILLLQGIDQRLVDIRKELYDIFFAMMDTLPVADYQSAFSALCEEKAGGLSRDERKTAGLRKSDAIAMAQQLSVPWMRTFIKLDPADYLAKVRCPILALNGGLDCQVLPSNLDDISRATAGKAQTCLLPGLNHLLQHCHTGLANEYMTIEETMSPEALERIASFILAR